MIATNDGNDHVSPRMAWPLRIGLLLTSIIWLSIWISLIVVARHAESLQKLHWAIWTVGIVMIAAGAVGAWFAIEEITGNRTKSLRFPAASLWLCAAMIVLGRAMSKQYWPLPEIIATAVLLVAATIFIHYRKKA